MKYSLTFILFLLAFTNVLGQKEFHYEILFHVKSVNNGEPIPNAKISYKIDSEKLKTIYTNEEGIVELKFQSKKSKKKIAIQIEAEGYQANDINQNTFDLINNYGHYKEFYLVKNQEFKHIEPTFYFPTNKAKPLKENLDLSYDICIESLNKNPITISLNAHYNFYEKDEIHLKRAEKIKKGIIKRGIDPNRIIIVIKDSVEYEFHHILDEDNNHIEIKMDEKFRKNASKEELKIMKSEYQKISIRINSWEYEP